MTKTLNNGTIVAPKSYGFIYDKAGNLKEVSAPETVKETWTGIGSALQSHRKYRKVKKHTVTKTGKLHDSVGFSMR